MATAFALPPTSDLLIDESSSADRQALVDSVLGTMGAEGEPPSLVAQAIMQDFVSGSITFNEMSAIILSHANQMVHEAGA